MIFNILSLVITLQIDKPCKNHSNDYVMIIVPQRLLSLAHLSRPLYQFCRINKKHNASPFISLSDLKQAVQKQHFFVRKHSQEIGNQLIYNIAAKKWSFARKMLQIININELDSWLILRKIAKAINNTCNNIKHDEMKEDINQLLLVLALLRFQPKRAENYYLQKGKRLYYDDSTPFINQLQQYIDKVSLDAQATHYLELAGCLIHTNPYLFTNRRIELEKRVLRDLAELGKSQSLLPNLLVKGCIYNFWTNSFKSQILKSSISDNYKKSLLFEDLGAKTKINKTNRQVGLKTQNQIMNILQGYGYQVQQNVEINGYQVDFIIANKLIVEYNGHHHYVINTDHLIPTQRDRWKQNVLKKRQFALCNIPYTQWKTLKLFEEKRNYLVNKIEKDWLRYYKSKQIKNDSLV